MLVLADTCTCTCLNGQRTGSSQQFRRLRNSGTYDHLRFAHLYYCSVLFDAILQYDVLRTYLHTLLLFRNDNLLIHSLCAFICYVCQQEDSSTGSTGVFESTKSSDDDVAVRPSSVSSSDVRLRARQRQSRQYPDVEAEATTEVEADGARPTAELIEGPVDGTTLHATTPPIVTNGIEQPLSQSQIYAELEDIENAQRASERTFELEALARNAAAAAADLAPVTNPGTTVFSSTPAADEGSFEDEEATSIGASAAAIATSTAVDGGDSILDVDGAIVDPAELVVVGKLIRWKPRS